MLRPTTLTLEEDTTAAVGNAKTNYDARVYSQDLMDFFHIYSHPIMVCNAYNLLQDANLETRDRARMPVSVSHGIEDILLHFLFQIRSFS